MNCVTVAEVKTINPQDLFTAAAQGQVALKEWETTIIGYIRTIEQLQTKIQTQGSIISYLEHYDIRQAFLASCSTPKEIRVLVPEPLDVVNPQ